MRPASLTSLRAYLQCPRQYSYAHVDYLPAEPDEARRRFAANGIVRDALTAWHAGGGGDWEALDRQLLALWDHSLFPDRRFATQEYHRVRWQLWEAFPRISQGVPVRFGYSFDLDFGGGRFRGRLDRVDEGASGATPVIYQFGPRRESDDHWGPQIYGAVVRRLLQKTVPHIRLLLLGAGEDEWLTPEDPARVEGDVARLRRAMSEDRTLAPRPGQHCRRCAYAEICEAAATSSGRASARQPLAEMFRLFRAVESLVGAGEGLEAFRSALESSVRLLDPKAQIHWLEGLAPSLEVQAIIEAQVEAEGTARVEDGRLAIVPGGGLVTPVADWCLVSFSAAVSCTAAEILGRSLRLAQSRAANFQKAFIDGGTGLRRREFFFQDLANGGQAIVACDIDHFKKVNDTWGHAAGDAVLRVFAGILSAQSDAIAYRIGGEEFVLLVPMPDLAYAAALAERVRAAAAATPVTHDSQVIVITASFGVAVPREGESGEEALARADAALYAAKTSGRNRVATAP